MTGEVDWRRGLAGFVFRSVMASVALVVPLAVPALAGACPSRGDVKSFSATASVSYQQSATGDDGQDGTATISISHSALGLRAPSVKAVPQERGFVFTGPTTGGMVSVSDTYADNDDPTISGAQEASGSPSGGESMADFSPVACTYQVTVSYGIDTTSTGDWPSPPDQGVLGIALSPPMTVPTDLKLSGTATIGAYASGDVNTRDGSFDTTGLASGGSMWEETLDDFTGIAPGQPLSTVTFTWNFVPTFTKHHKKKKPKHKPNRCLVPKLRGVGEAAAKHDLKEAHCSLGKISKHQSSKVTKGKVISSNPKAGSSHKPGTKVAITVSGGKH
jgi:hypothetical protein